MCRSAVLDGQNKLRLAVLAVHYCLASHLQSQFSHPLCTLARLRSTLHLLPLSRTVDKFREKLVFATLSFLLKALDDVDGATSMPVSVIIVIDIVSERQSGNAVLLAKRIWTSRKRLGVCQTGTIA